MGINSTKNKYDAQFIVKLMKERLNSGGECKLVVTGNSMSPILKHKISTVILTSPKNRKLKNGEIVFVQRDSGEYILHRVYKIIGNDKFIMNGDAQTWVETVRFNQVIGIVKTIVNKNKEISCDDFIYRLKILVWMKCIKIRKYIFGNYARIKKFRVKY